MLKELKEKNCELNFYDVNSSQFSSYGKIINDIDISEIVLEAKKIKNPESGSMYQPSVEAFEKLNIADTIRSQLFGESKIQVGYCWGYNSVFGAAFSVFY